MYTLIVIALASYTAIALLFKAAATRTRSDHLVVVALTVVALAASLTMAMRGEWGGSWLGAAIALVAGYLFYVASVFRVRALATTPVALVFALTNLDLVVSGGLALLLPVFGQTLTVWNLLAVLVAGSAVLLGATLRGIERISPDTFVALAILSASALGAVLYARLFPASLLFFIVLDHLAGVVLNGRALRSVRRAEIAWGTALGLCMFIGIWALLQALAVSGNATTLVLLAVSLKTPLIAVLAVPIFKERVTRHQLGAVVLATLAILLWEIG